MAELMKLKRDLGYGLDASLAAAATGFILEEQTPGKEAEQAITHLFEIIKKQRKDVDRSVVAASLGKISGALPESGLLKKSSHTMALFLTSSVERGGFSPFKKIVGELREFFDRRSDIRVLGDDGETVISIEVKGLVQVDVHPALSLKGEGWGVGMTGHGHVRRRKRQRDETLKLMSHLPDPTFSSFYYNAGLAESVAHWAAEKLTPFSQRLVRLAKFWVSQIEFPDTLCQCPDPGQSSGQPQGQGQPSSKHKIHVPSLAYLVTVIAVHATDLLSIQGTNENLLDALETFLSLLQDFQTLRVNLFEEPPNQNPNSAKDNSKDKHKIPAKFDAWDVRAQGPLIVDAINPYTNLARFSPIRCCPGGGSSKVENGDLVILTQSIISCLEERADLCLRKLRRLKKKSGARILLGSKQHVLQIFDGSAVPTSKKRQWYQDNQIPREISNLRNNTVILGVLAVVFVILAILAIVFIELKK